MKRKSLYVLILLSIGFMVSIPASGQSFINKALKKVEKGLDALAGEKQEEKKQEEKPAQTTVEPAKETPVPEKTVVETPAVAPKVQDTPYFGVAPQTEQTKAVVKEKSDLEKNNLKGRVKKVTERITGGSPEFQFTTDVIYTYNNQGMLLKLAGEDEDKRRTINGTVECKYNNNGQLVSRTVNIPDYISFGNFKGPEESTTTFTYNTNGQLTESYEVADKQTTHYSYNNQGQLAKTEKTASGAQFASNLYVYDVKGNLIEIHMDKITYPTESFKYNSQNRVIEHDGPSQIKKYEYNNNGDVVVERTVGKFGEEEDMDEESRYSYEYDAKKNWIKRIWKDAAGKTVNTTTRVIEYYTE